MSCCPYKLGGRRMCDACWRETCAAELRERRRREQLRQWAWAIGASAGVAAGALVAAVFTGWLTWMLTTGGR